MKLRRVATFAEEGKWTPGADSTLIIEDWQAWVDGEGHWKVRGPDPDNEAHYADGDIELTEAEYTEAGNSEARRKIRAQRAKKAARAYIQSMLQSSGARHHATKKKSAAQLNQEIAEALSIHRIQFRVPGSPWVWLTPNGSGTMNPLGAYKFPSREAAEARAATMQGPRSSLQAKVVSMKAV